jgi:hypothetical protein
MISERVKYLQIKSHVPQVKFFTDIFLTVENNSTDKILSSINNHKCRYLFPVFVDWKSQTHKLERQRVVSLQFKQIEIVWVWSDQTFLSK